MAISRSPVVSNLGAFVVIDTDVDENAQVNTTGSAGTLRLLAIDNTANSGVVYVKFYEGLTFAVGFTHVCVTTAAPGANGPGSAVKIRYVTT